MYNCRDKKVFFVKVPNSHGIVSSNYVIPFSVVGDKKLARNSMLDNKEHEENTVGSDQEEMVLGHHEEYSHALIRQ